MRLVGRSPVALRPATLLLSLAAVAALLPGAGAQGPPREERPIGPSTLLARWTVTDNAAGPLALAAVTVDAADPLIRVGVSLGSVDPGKSDALGLEPISSQALRRSRPDSIPIAGVNGDFFYFPNAGQPGIPTNAAVNEGELIRTPFRRSALLLRARGVPEIVVPRSTVLLTLPGNVGTEVHLVNHPRGQGQLVLYTPWYGASTRTKADGVEVALTPERVRLGLGETLQARVESPPSPAGNAAIAPGSWVLSGSGPAAELLRGLTPGQSVRIKAQMEPALEPGDQILGGGPRLLRDGKISVEQEGGTMGEAFARARHPRTAVGFDGRRLRLVVVDGRQPGHSVGMTLPELAQVMLDLGCREAMNLDGGGSTTLWARGEVVNRPSDGRERPVANGLLVYSSAPQEAPTRLRLGPGPLALLPGATAAVSIVGEDQYYNPRPIEPSAIAWSVPPRLGTIEGGQFRAAESVVADAGTDAATGAIRATSGDISGELPVRIVPRPARVEILPGATRIGPARKVAFRVRAFDGRGAPLLLPRKLDWSLEGPVGEIDESGTVTTPDHPARGKVRVVVAGVLAMVDLEVLPGAGGVLDDFESSLDWKLTTSGDALGVVATEPGTVRGGKRALRLSYDFSRGGGTRAVYAAARRVLGSALACRFWVYGDGSGAWLRVRLRDAKGMSYLLDASRSVDWKGEWRELRVPISEDYPTPVTLEAIYVVETDPARKRVGTLWIDDLDVDTAP